MANHDWILANLINVMAYAEREGLVTVRRAVEQAIIQASDELSTGVEEGDRTARKTIFLVS